MRTLATAIVAAIILMMGAACYWSGVCAQTISGEARVVDGDTIRINGEHQRFRLYGIDAPEIAQMCRDFNKHDYPCGYEAARYLQELIGPLHVTCTADKKDIYGRWLSKCSTLLYLDLSQAMVSRGWATVRYLRYETQDLWKEQERAQREKRGLWDGTFTQPWDWRKENKRLP